MKSLKLLIGSSLMVPAAVAPAILSSCSVYKDLKSGFNPSYEQLDGRAMTAEQAANAWFDKAKEIGDFGSQEFYKCNAEAANFQYDEAIEKFSGVTYTSEYTGFYVNVNYFKADSTTHQISYKITANIDEKDIYKYNGSIYGSGVTHYTIEYEIKNFVFDIASYEDSSTTKSTHILVKPNIFVYSPEKGWYWKENLKNDEEMSFNLRYLVEIYNKNDIQSYGYEATEAAVLDKDHSYLPELKDILNYFCSFWSYYLAKITLI